jgi:hypothetical protein
MDFLDFSFLSEWNEGYSGKRPKKIPPIPFLSNVEKK